MTAPASPLRGAHAGTPALWRPGNPVFWVLGAALVACTPLQLIALASAPAAAPADSLAVLAVLAVTAAMAAVQLLVLWMVASTLLGGRHRPLSLRLTAVAWGAIVVPVIAAFANSRHLTALNILGLRSFAASIAAPLDEDTLRLVGTLGVLALLSGTSLTLRDGVLCGFLVGTGFEVVENVSFVLGATDPASALQAAAVRTGIGFGLHSLWTGTTAATLAACLVRRRAGLSPCWTLLAAGLAIPMLLHALWDAPGFSVAPTAVIAVLAAVYLVSVALFTGCVRSSLLSPPAPRRIPPP